METSECSEYRVVICSNRAAVLSCFTCDLGNSVDVVLTELLRSLSCAPGEVLHNSNNCITVPFTARDPPTDQIREAIRKFFPNADVNVVAQAFRLPAAGTAGESPRGDALPLGVLCLDMDSTIVSVECIDLLAKAHGVGDEVASVTAAAMRGELDFAESLKRRVALLKGMPRSVMDHHCDQLLDVLNPGAKELIEGASAAGMQVFVFSGGFTPFVQKLCQTFPITAGYANELEFVDGVCSGNLLGEIVDASRKRSLLLQKASECGVSSRATVAVGDGANDILMLKEAGLGVAYHAKPITEAAARASLRYCGLDAVLWLMGLDVQCDRAAETV